MAADLSQGPRHDRRGSLALDNSVASSFDPSLDPTIRQLFEQQAEIQAKLAALLPTKYVPNSKLELGMLRLKLRALEEYAENKSKFINVKSPEGYNLTLVKIYRPRHHSCQRLKRLEHCSTNASV